MKNSLFILFLLVTSSLLSQDLETLYLEQATKHSDYIKAEYELKQVIAKKLLDDTDKYGSLDFSFDYYDNEIDREETKESLEITDINELDKKLKLEYRKQFFPSDFDSSIDDFENKLDLMLARYNLAKAKLRSLEQVIDDSNDAIAGKYALIFNQKKKNIIDFEQESIEMLESNNIIEVDDLISLYDDLLDLQKDMTSDKIDLLQVQSIYDKDFLDNIFVLFEKQNYSDIETEENMESELAFKNSIMDLSSSLTMMKAKSVLPEINLQLSYNYRKTNQDWLITENLVTESFDRVQEEYYPEVSLSLSLPLNIYSNMSGKFKLISSYKQQLLHEEQDLQEWFDSFLIKYRKEYINSSKEITYLEKINALYQKKMNNYLKRNDELSESLNPQLQYELNKIKFELDVSNYKLQMKKLARYQALIILNKYNKEIEKLNE